MHEPALQRRGRNAAEVAMRVEDRQQRKSDARGVRGPDDAPGELGGIGVRLAARIVMHVMEFGDRCIARLRHLDIGLRGDRFERVGIEPVDCSVHRLAPRPERVVAIRRRDASAAGDRTLERMRMQIRHRRNDRARQPFIGGGLRPMLDAVDPAGLVDDDCDIRGPSFGEQGGGRVQ